MKATVITYWQLQIDESEFIEFLGSSTDVFASKSYWAVTKEEVTPRPLNDMLIAEPANQFLIGRSDEFKSECIEQKEFDNTVLFGISCVEHPVLLYRRGSQSNGTLGQSSLSVYPNYFETKSNSIVTKSEDFMQWTKSIFEFVRRATPEKLICDGYYYRASKRVKMAVESGSIMLVLY